MLLGFTPGAIPAHCYREKMKPSAFRALIIAIALPIGIYFLMGFFNNEKLRMPPKYFADTVLRTERAGRQHFDTVWHTVADFHLVNQLADTVSWKDMKGRIVILNFFFTSCQSFCPRLSTNMHKLQQALVKSPDMVRLLSISVDPQHDDVNTLKKYADKYLTRHDIWWFLTGEREHIYALAQDELHVGISEGVKDDFVHTDKFILLDKNRVIRGYYGGQDEAELDRLLRDVSLLHLERQR